MCLPTKGWADARPAHVGGGGQDVQFVVHQHTVRVGCQAQHQALVEAPCRGGGGRLGRDTRPPAQDIHVQTAAVLSNLLKEVRINEAVDIPGLTEILIKFINNKGTAGATHGVGASARANDGTPRRSLHAGVGRRGHAGNRAQLGE